MTEGQSGIYTITNLSNGKVYIGSTIDFDVRWRDHQSYLYRGAHSNKYLQRSWNKYGEDAFEFGILEYLEDVDELVKAEQFWMDIYHEEGKELYNYGSAADNPMRGQKHTEDSKHKMSVAAKGNQYSLGCKRSKETRLKTSEANRGKKRSKETRQKMSESARQRPPMSEESRCKVSESNKGKKRSREARRRISEALTGRKRGPMSEDQKRKIGMASRGRKHSKETKCKISKSMRGGKHSEETRCRMSVAAKRRPPHSEETRRKMSESQKARWAKIRGKV